MVTPIAMREVLIGKIVPYFLLGVGGMTLSVTMALWQFGVPLRGSVWVLARYDTVPAHGARYGAPHFDGGASSICRRAGRYHNDVPAGIHSLRVHLRCREYADRDPDTDTHYSGTLFCFDSANSVPRW